MEIPAAWRVRDRSENSLFCAFCKNNLQNRYRRCTVMSITATQARRQKSTKRAIATQIVKQLKKRYNSGAICLSNLLKAHRFPCVE